MASFQAKIGWKRMRKRENKNYSYLSFLPDAQQTTRDRNPKIIAKKFKNLKNTIMASLQAKIGWKWMRNRENKNYHYVSFQPDAKQKIKKKKQNNSNI